ncbi:MAG TPA: response regulator transcription factor [Ktedonobacterales bacterium]|nr:response regulator transcription factor [Ktedonobacterales bacterium]
MRILVVEDDPQLGPALKERLESQYHATDLMANGPDGLTAALAVPYDLVIVDVLLPGMDGFALCRELRARRVATPCLLLTALDAIEQRIAGLDAGADDYLCKPFAFGELDARVRALLRRASQEKSPVLRAGDLTLDPKTHVVQRSGRAVPLTSKEFALLEYFLRHAGHVLSRAQLVEHVWDFEAEHLSNVLEVFIANLRRKLGEPDLIHTVRGSGYQLRVPEDS